MAKNRGGIELGMTKSKKRNYSFDLFVFAFNKNGEGVTQSGHFFDLTGVFFWKGCLNPKCSQKDMI